jgi:hypothetical protein
MLKLGEKIKNEKMGKLVNISRLRQTLSLP